jgi:prolyl-tRNA synthetase
LTWPKAVSPFDIHLVPLFLNKDESVRSIAANLYAELSEYFDVLLDDRDLSPGVSLSDADLIGIPLRVVVSPKTLQIDSVEVKLRSCDTVELVKLSELVKYLTVNW